MDIVLESSAFTAQNRFLSYHFLRSRHIVGDRLHRRSRFHAPVMGISVCGTTSHDKGNDSQVGPSPWPGLVTSTYILPRFCSLGLLDGVPHLLQVAIIMSSN